MPRPKKPGAPEPKRRSRNGCWPCKNRKIKCGEEHPTCLNCQKVGETCDYSIRLNWDGRRGKRPEPGTIDFSSQEVPSPTVPAKGFKLVHQFPTSSSTSGRKLEPLVSPGSSTPESSIGSTARISTHRPETSIDQFQIPNKRIRLDPEPDASAPIDRGAYSSPSSTGDATTPAFRAPASGSTTTGSPLTPAASSTYSEEGRHGHRTELQSNTSPELRRMSIHSVLSGPPGTSRSHEDPTSYPSFQSPTAASQNSQASGPKLYGIDRGLPDLDLGKNDDINAIGTGYSPLSNRSQLDAFVSEFDTELFPAEFAFGVESLEASEATGAYYDKPVEIYIPQQLEPLPRTLINSPMNLLYFHHFINHTAKVLVPYDDPHANPFRTTLPLMAVKNANLLALVLAYSASHRARVLRHPEPTVRIAFWVDDIFPALREALSDPDHNFSDANVATAIMLASLEIVSPKVFGYEIPWQKHLSLARELITSRPNGLHYQQNFRQNHVCSFLWSWAAYLDVIGSLSGGPRDSSTAWMFDYEMEDMSDGYDEIDCIMGFTTRCVYLLAKIADLARKCDADRTNGGSEALQSRKPNADVVALGQRLEADVKDSMSQPITPCKHIHTGGNLDKWDRVELAATNEAFHLAGLIHLYRRVLGRPTADKDVQAAVSSIVDCFSKRIRRGSTAETCSLFPIFTAGCDAQDEDQRAFILERLEAGETHGMSSAVLKVNKARRLMERVWETGQPWETLLSTEFIG